MKMRLISSETTYQKPILITLTSVPSRLNYELPITLESLLLHQSYPKSKIRVLLAVAHQDYQLFIKARGKLAILQDPRIEIKSVDDFKAAKKFISAIEENKHNDQIVITVDDDYFYTPSLIETLVKNYNLLNSDPSRKAAVSIMGYRINQDKTWGAELKSKTWFSFSEFSYYFVRGWRIKRPFRISITTGSGGVCFNSKWFKDVQVSDFVGAPENAPLLDDIWLNGILSGLGVERYAVPIDSPSTSLVRKSVIDSTLDNQNRNSKLNHNAKRYEANNEMIAYFDSEFTKEDVWYELHAFGGKTHPEYISYLYIGLVEPIKLFWRSIYVSVKYPLVFAL